MALGTGGVGSWTEVATALAPARSYWLGTTSRDGAPHAAPVWGAVVDARLYLYSERHTVKAKNLERDPRAVVHLESAEHVVIVHGHLLDLGRPGGSPEAVDAFDAKYDAPGDDRYLPSSDEAFDVLYLLRPERALLWDLSDYDASQQRWTAPQGSAGDD